MHSVHACKHVAYISNLHAPSLSFAGRSSVRGQLAKPSTHGYRRLSIETTLLPSKVPKMGLFLLNDFDPISDAHNP